MSKYVLYGAVAGAAVGIIPLVFGILRSRKLLGAISIITCLIGGAFLGLTLAIPLCCIFMYFILDNHNEDIIITAKRKCPYCHYDIQMDAKKCSHCNRNIF